MPLAVDFSEVLAFDGGIDSVELTVSLGDSELNDAAGALTNNGVALPGLRRVLTH